MGILDENERSFLSSSSVSNLNELGLEGSSSDEETVDVGAGGYGKGEKEKGEVSLRVKEKGRREVGRR